MTRILLSDLIDASIADIVPAGNRTIILGESMSLGDSDVSFPSRGPRDFMAWASLLEPRIVYQRNSGVGTQSSADLLAAIQTRVLDYAPDWCWVQAGTKDSGDSVPLATYAANVKAIVAALRNAGIKPVLFTVWPYANTTRQQFIHRYNTWLSYWCARQGIPLVDVHEILTDPATGGMKSAYDLDGIHSNAAAAKVIGQLAADMLGPLYPPWTPPLARHQAAGTLNLLSNGLFLTDTNADGAADGWSKSGAAATASIVTGDTAIIGNWQKFASTNASDAFLSPANITTGFTVGDTIAFCGRLSAHADSTTGNFTLKINWTGNGGSLRPFDNWSVDVTDGVFYAEAVVPSGTTAIAILLTDYGDSDAGSGWEQLAQITVLNLTTMGVLAA